MMGGFPRPRTNRGGRKRSPVPKLRPITFSRHVQQGPDDRASRDPRFEELDRLIAEQERRHDEWESEAAE